MKRGALTLLLLAGLTGTACAAGPPTATPAPLPTAFATTPGPDASAVVARLRARGLDARATGERSAPRFGAHTVETVRVDGAAVVVFVFADQASAAAGLQAVGPSGALGDALEKVHVAGSGNLLLVVFTNDDARAGRILAALR